MKTLAFNTFILFNFFSFIIITGKGQELITGKGKAIIYFESNNSAIIRLDTSLIRSSSKPIILEEGKHIVKAWAPTKKLFIDTLIIKEGKTTFCTKKLENTVEYNAYKKKLSNYKFKKVCSQFIPLPLTVGYSTYAYLTYNKNKKLIQQHFENAKDAKANYETSLSLHDIELNKTLYYKEKDAYESYLNKNNNLSKIAAVAIPVGVLTSVALFCLSKKIIKPIYTEQKLLSLGGVNVNYEGSIYSCSILININNTIK